MSAHRSVFLLLLIVISWRRASSLRESSSIRVRAHALRDADLLGWPCGDDVVCLQRQLCGGVCHHPLRTSFLLLICPPLDCFHWYLDGRWSESGGQTLVCDTVYNIHCLRCVVLVTEKCTITRPSKRTNEKEVHERSLSI